MAEFNTLVISQTLRGEGVASDSVVDLGGYTKYGISQKNHPNINVPTLTLEDAIQLWKTEYWDKFRLTEINNQLLADAIFDMFFNMSNISAGTTLQLALNKCGCQVNIDGVMGSETIAAANRVEPVDWLIAQLEVERVKFYLGRVDASPTQLANFRSWIRRTVS